MTIPLSDVELTVWHATYDTFGDQVVNISSDSKTASIITPLIQRETVSHRVDPAKIRALGTKLATVTLAVVLVGGWAVLRSHP